MLSPEMNQTKQLKRLAGHGGTPAIHNIELGSHGERAFLTDQIKAFLLKLAKVPVQYHLEPVVAPWF
jgi:hypothetical protein